MKHLSLVALASLLAPLTMTGAAARIEGAPRQAAPPSTADIWYLGHAGFAVRTSGYFLVFDYQERRDGQKPKTRPAQPSLAAGWIDPREIKDLKVRVFASHSHDDHFDPVIFGWKSTTPDIAYFFGWKAAEDPAYHYLVGPRAFLKLGGLEIATINSHHSGVPEVGWLVKVDGLVIYHNGDCQPQDAAAEHASLKTKTDRIDLAFVPPVYEDGQKYTAQNLDLFRQFDARAVFPMHVEAGGSRYLEFEKASRGTNPGLSIQVPRRMGQQWRYEGGEIRPPGTAALTQ